MPKDSVLDRVRTALGRNTGQAPQQPPAVELRVTEMTLAERVAAFRAALEALAGTVAVARDCEEARRMVSERIAGSWAVASNSRFLDRCGIDGVEGVRRGFSDGASLKAACAEAPFGITSADYALADTGTLVMMASAEEQRLISLLPPVHIALVPVDRLLSGLDDLFTREARPNDRTSSMVLITGPSRTADIEQILVRGVHGPGKIEVILVETELKPKASVILGGSDE